jgi:hypothetical protein
LQSDLTTSVFNESHSVTTTAQGLINLNIGSVNTTDLALIDWAADEYFVQITVDGTIMGTSQLLSVPYALTAKTVETVDYSQITNTPQNVNIIAGSGISVTGTYPDITITNTVPSSTHYVGELYGGGIVYWVDHTGEHGLIASLDDLDNGSLELWSNITDTEIGAGAQSYYDGLSNTAAIIAQSGHTSSAAKLCDEYSNDGFSDWYLPSNQELRYMESSSLIIYKVLDNDGNQNTNGLYPYPNYYWSSTEYAATQAYQLRLNNSTMISFSKNSSQKVRAVRAF